MLDPIQISPKTGYGINKLKKLISRKILVKKTPQEMVNVTTVLCNRYS
jgi:hypothetical protein